MESRQESSISFRITGSRSSQLVMSRPVVLADVMPEWEAAWRRVVKRYGLVDQPLTAVAK